MKPRLFVGSSVEGLGVANAVQQNLWRVAEVTVWTQGVFTPSSITLPAILDSLSSQDFGLFVFTPDDVALIKHGVHSVVRDNVLFELGIFMGRLGLDRSFFLVPEDGELRLASDLLGVTPLRYETKRSDDNLVAAVGPACNEVSVQIKRMGLNPRLGEATAGTTATKVEKDSAQKEQAQVVEVVAAETVAVGTQEVTEVSTDQTEEHWVDALMADDFTAMRDRLSVAIASVADEKERPRLESWHAYAEYRINRARGKRAFDEVQRKYSKDPEVYHIAAIGFLWHGLPEETLEVAERGLLSVDEGKAGLLVSKAQALRLLQREDDAIDALRLAVAEEPPSETAYSLLAEILISRKEYAQARSSLEDGLLRIPRNTKLISKYASLLADHFDKKAALTQYDSLVAIKPDNSTALTLRANIYLELGLNDLAMRDYKAANEAAEGKQGWILANIGNLYKNVGLYTDAIEFFERALRIESSASYTHERLAGALKLRDEQAEARKAFELEGRRILMQLRLTPATESQPVAALPDKAAN